MTLAIMVDWAVIFRGNCDYARYVEASFRGSRYYVARFVLLRRW